MPLHLNTHIGKGFANKLILICTAITPIIASATGKVTVTDGQVVNGIPVEISNQHFVFKTGSDLISIPIEKISSYFDTSKYRLESENGEILIGKLFFTKGYFSIKSSLGDISTAQRTPLKLSEIGAEQIDLRHIRGRGPDDVKSKDLKTNQESPENGQTPPRKQKEDEDFVADYSSVRNQAVLLSSHAKNIDISASIIRNTHQFQSDTATSMMAQLSYGISDRLEANLTVPYFFTYRESQVGDSDPTSKVRNGTGDIKLGLKYSLSQNNYNLSEWVFNGAIQAPTGRNPYQSPNSAQSNAYYSSYCNSALAQTNADMATACKNLQTYQQNAKTFTGNNNLARDSRDPTYMQIGSGHWSLTGGLTWIRNFDPVVVFAGADITVYKKAEYFGLKIKPGNRYGFTMGASFLASERSSFTGQVTLYNYSSTLVDNVPVIWSKTTPVSTRLAYTHRISDRETIEPSISFGLTGDATNAVITMGYSKKFD